MSIGRKSDGVYKVRWWEGGRQKSLLVHGSFDLAKKIERKRLSARDENRHLDIKREVNYRMATLIDRYWRVYGSKKKSYSREKSVLEGVRSELGQMFVREVDGSAITTWFENLTVKRGLSAGTAVRHFNVMHHMMEKAATIWSKETGIDRNPADQVEVKRPNDERDRYLSKEELGRLKKALDDRLFRRGTRAINRTFFRLRLLVLTALTTGMRVSEIFALTWSDILHSESLIAVRSKLKGGRFRYVPLTPELAAEYRRSPKGLGAEQIFPAKQGAKGDRQRVEGSFRTLLDVAKIKNFRFHDLRHTFASWYMMNGGDLYELAKILGHSNIKMTERYAKLGRLHIAKTGNTAREMWNLLGPERAEPRTGRRSSQPADVSLLCPEAKVKKIGFR
jgi:integrase